MRQWRLLSRVGCHLCDEFLDELTPQLPATVRVARCNVDEREEWRIAFGRRIPVLLDAAGDVLYAADTPVSFDRLLQVAKAGSSE